MFLFLSLPLLATCVSSARLAKCVSPARASDGSSGGTSPSDIQAYLTGHNSIRAEHGAADLTWSDDLASKAQQWANKCEFQHSDGSLGPYGGRIFVTRQSLPGYTYILLRL